MEFYSNTKPKLVSNKIEQNYNNILNKKTVSVNINDNITVCLIKLYQSYIEPNIAILIIFSIIVYGLYTRYMDTQKKKSYKGKI